MPRSRIPLFTERLAALCAEAELPSFDETKYDVLTDTLYFRWLEPPFCLAAPLAKASAYGLTAADLRGAWEAKFGTAEEAA